MSIYQKSPILQKIKASLKNKRNSSKQFNLRSQSKEHDSNFTFMKYKNHPHRKPLNEDDDRSLEKVLQILDKEDIATGFQSLMLVDKSKTVTSESHLQQILTKLDTVACAKNKSKIKIKKQHEFKIKNPPPPKIVCNVNCSLKAIKNALLHLSNPTQNNNLENVATNPSVISTLKLSERILPNNSNKLRQADFIQKQGTTKGISNLSDSNKDVLPQSQLSTQGELVMVQKTDACLVLNPRTQTDLVNHSVRSLVNISLTKMLSNNNQENEEEILDNSEQRLNTHGRKLYNAPDLKKDYKRKPKARPKVTTLITSKTQQNCGNEVERVEADTSSPTNCYINQHINMVVTADIEPYPAGVINKRKQPKRHAKKCQKLRTPVDLDAIEVVFSPVNRKPGATKITQYNQQHTTLNKENASPNVLTEKPKRKNYVKKGKVGRTSKPKSNAKIRKQSNMEHTSVIDQPQKNVDSPLAEQEFNYDSLMKAMEKRLKSANKTDSTKNAARKVRKYVVSKKTSNRRSFNNRHSLKTRHKLTNTLEKQDMGESSSSISLPELEVVKEKLVEPEKLEFLTSSDSEPNNDVRLVSTNCSAEVRQVGVVKTPQKINIISTILVSEWFEKEITQANAQQMNLEENFDSNNLNLEMETFKAPKPPSQIMETDGFECSSSHVQNLRPTHESMPDHLEDQREVNRNTTQTVLHAFADIIKAHLNLFSEQVATDDIRIQTTLCKLDCILENHFKHNSD